MIICDIKGEYTSFFFYFCVQRPAYWVDHWPQEPKVSIQGNCFPFWSFEKTVEGWYYFSFQFWWHCVGDPEPWHTASRAGVSESTAAGLQRCKSLPCKRHKPLNSLPQHYLFCHLHTIFIMALHWNCTAGPTCYQVKSPVLLLISVCC